MVTAELAAGLPVLVLLMLTGVAAVQVADARVRCLDAAREVARASARADPGAIARGARLVPSSARISVATSASTVTATVRVSVHPLGVEVADVVVTEQASAALEKQVAAKPAWTRSRSPVSLR